MYIMPKERIDQPMHDARRIRVSHFKYGKKQKMGNATTISTTREICTGKISMINVTFWRAKKFGVREGKSRATLIVTKF